MRVFDIMLEFRVVSFVKTRLMVDVCPLLSSLVGTFGLFVSLNDSPLSHSRVSLVCVQGVYTIIPAQISHVPVSGDGCGYGMVGDVVV